MVVWLANFRVLLFPGQTATPLNSCLLFVWSFSVTLSKKCHSAVRFSSSLLDFQIFKLSSRCCLNKSSLKRKSEDHSSLWSSSIIVSELVVFPAMSLYLINIYNQSRPSSCGTEDPLNFCHFFLNKPRNSGQSTHLFVIFVHCSVTCSLIHYLKHFHWFNSVQLCSFPLLAYELLSYLVNKVKLNPSGKW